MLNVPKIIRENGLQTVEEVMIKELEHEFPSATFHCIQGFGGIFVVRLLGVVEVVTVVASLSQKKLHRID